MKFAVAFIVSFVAVSLVWTAVVWGCVFLSAAVYPDSIHNPVSMLGVMAFGPVAGILTAVVAFRYFYEEAEDGKPTTRHYLKWLAPGDAIVQICGRSIEHSGRVGCEPSVSCVGGGDTACFLGSRLCCRFL